MHPLYVHPLYDGVRCTTSVSFRVGSKLPLPVYADVRHSDGASHPLGLLSADTFHHHGGDHNQACKAAGAQDSICQFLNAIVHVNLACTCRNMRPPLLSHPPPFVRLPFGTLALFMHVSSPLRREGNVDMCTPLRRVYSFFFSFFLGGRLLQGYIHCFTDATRNIGKGWFVHRAHVAYMSFLGGVLLPLAHTPRSLSSVQATASVRTLGGVLRSHVHT